ncbi:MAG: hypothetical protein K5786_09170 [Treponema sp.]|nr:hypothetical protein [Treponema sp.]
MKKIAFIAGAFLLATMVFVGCKQDAGTVEEVTVEDIVSEAKDEGIVFNENAKAVDSVTVFSSKVMPELISSFSSLDLQSLLSLNNLKNAKFLGSLRAAITEEDIQNAIEDLQTQIENFQTKMEAEENFDATIDWSAPTGEYTVVDGLVLTINEGSVYTNISGGIESGNANVEVKANMSADAKSKANLQKAFEIKTIPYARFAVKGNYNVNGKASGPENMDGPEDLDIAVTANAYYGYSGAVIFNLDEYAGAIKIDATVTVDANIDSALVEKYYNMFSQGFDKSKLSKTFFDELPVDLSLTISIYDVDGNKMFNLISAESLYDAYTEIISLVE